MIKKIKLNNLAVSIVMFIVCVSFVSVMLMQFKTVEETDITDIEKKILEQGSFKPNEIFEKSFRTENGLKIDYQDDYTPKGR